MDVSGKVLVITKHIVISQLNGSLPLTHVNRFTGNRKTLEAGALVFGVFNYTPSSSNFKEMRDLGMPTIPYVVVMYDNHIWECVPDAVRVLSGKLPLVDKTICFTGDNEYGRSFWKKMVELHGGMNTSSVTRKTSYLVFSATDTTKYKQAEKYEVPKISYAEFNNLLDS